MSGDTTSNCPLNFQNPLLPFNMDIVTVPNIDMKVNGKNGEIQHHHQHQQKRKRFNKELDLFLSDSEREKEEAPTRRSKISRKGKDDEEFLDDLDDENMDDAQRIHYLDLEIHRLQNLCRENFSMIDTLRKENAKLLEIQSELKETTTDLAYSLAEFPWWQRDEFKNSALQILTSFTQNVQYILELPTLVDPVEQLITSGLSKEKAISLLRRRRILKTNMKIQPKLVFKCPTCNKYFSSQERLRTHSAIHTNRKRLIGCKICRKNFPSFSSLRDHCSKTHPDPDPVIPCSSAIQEINGAATDSIQPSISNTRSLLGTSSIAAKAATVQPKYSNLAADEMSTVNITNAQD